MSTEQSPRTQTLLLAIIAGLLATQLLALGVGVIWVRGQLQQLSQGSADPVAAVQENLAETRKAAQALTQRQARLAAALDEVASQTAMQVKALQQRRSDLGPVQKGPVDKVDQVIGLMQLLSDELLLVLEHLSATQGALARSTRPSDAQKELVSPE